MSEAPRKPKKVRRRLNFAVAWLNSTTEEIDEHGNVLSPERTCFVVLPPPPGVEHLKSVSRDAFKRACKKAVYEHELEEYGNKKLAIISWDDTFEVPFEKKTITKLLPPE